LEEPKTAGQTELTCRETTIELNVPHLQVYSRN
jgi:hypothetical protein